jgi:hypothetical protein
MKKLKMWLLKAYGIRWVQIATVVFVVVFYFYNRGILEKSRREPINFYTKSGLMYLIDMRESENYNLYTINEMRELDSDSLHYSYENYIKYVNTHKAYKYND